MMKKCLIVVGIVLITLIGCCGFSGSSAQKGGQNEDGEVVLPTSTQQAEETPPPEPTETIISDLCISVSETELESYVFTQKDNDCYLSKYLTPAAGGRMDYDDCDDALSEMARAACYGTYSGFLGDNHKCSDFLETVQKDACLVMYAGTAAASETTAVSVHLCDGILNESFMDECLSQITEFLPCQTGDSICPSECNYLTDSDCSAYALGQKAITDGGIAITISGPGENRHCYSDYGEYLGLKSYGHYYVLYVEVKNSGTEAEYVSSSDFILVDSDGIQHNARSSVVGESCEDRTGFVGGNLYPGSSASGELWFELGGKLSLPSGEKKIIYEPNMFINGDELIFVFN